MSTGLRGYSYRAETGVKTRNTNKKNVKKEHWTPTKEKLSDPLKLYKVNKVLVIVTEV